MGGTGLLLVLILTFLLRPNLTFLQKLALTLFFAGGVSNLIDRLYRGSVVDFMNIGIGGLRTGIFNIADVAIMAAMALMIVANYRSQKI